MTIAKRSAAARKAWRVRKRMAAGRKRYRVPRKIFRPMALDFTTLDGLRHAIGVFQRIVDRESAEAAPTAPDYRRALPLPDFGKGK